MNDNVLLFDFNGNTLTNIKRANVVIPTGCLSGSCGACEIDVNGNTVRPCISNIKSSNQKLLNIEFTSDPYWN